MEKKTILVVDDEVDFLKIVQKRLEAGGYDVIIATDGKEALDKVKNNKLDAVLLDILMPGMNGLEVLKKIRQEHKNLPVFIITAFSSDENFELAQRLNASGFIVKTNDLKKEVDNITTFIDIADKFKT
jgi:CheY-like chemotaxis protein